MGGKVVRSEGLV